MRTGQRCKSGLISAGYRKLLRLSPAARIGRSAGEISNLLSADAQRIAELLPYLHALWFAPLQVMAAVCLLLRELGAAVIPGVTLIAVMLQLNKKIVSASFRCQQLLIGVRDERAAQTRELLVAMRVIKLHAWEFAFAERVRKIRARELALLKRQAWLRATLGAVFSCTPTLVAVAMLGAHVAFRSGTLTLQTAMAVLATMGLLRSPLLFFPVVLQNMIEAELRKSHTPFLPTYVTPHFSYISSHFFAASGGSERCSTMMR